jgi:hypothetical protein
MDCSISSPVSACTHATFESDEYSSAVAKSLEEAGRLIEAGFEYVCMYNDYMLFRKRK